MAFWLACDRTIQGVVGLVSNQMVNGPKGRPWAGLATVEMRLDRARFNSDGKLEQMVPRVVVKLPLISPYDLS